VFAVRDVAPFLARDAVAMRAAEWAADAHRGHERQVDGAPFILHPLEVGLILHMSGYGGDAVAAGILHDVVEKGDVTVDELRRAFGDAIAGIVAALTEDPAIAGYRERKAALRARAEESGDETLLAVFAADKLAKARELRLAAAADRLSADELASRRAHYRESLEVLERRLPEHPLTDGLRFELELQTRVPALSWLAAGATARLP
jgi:(p)ppGpp synthase/HD superfamily hydrolase